MLSDDPYTAASGAPGLTSARGYPAAWRRGGEGVGCRASRGQKEAERAVTPWKQPEKKRSWSKKRKKVFIKLPEFVTISSAGRRGRARPSQCRQVVRGEKKKSPPLCLTASQYGCHPRLFHSAWRDNFSQGTRWGQKKKSNFKAAHARLVCHIGNSEYLPCGCALFEYLEGIPTQKLCHFC